MTRRRSLFTWLDRRLAIGSLLKLGRDKSVPVHRASVIYYLGGITLFLFLLQVVTGILLMLYYRPSTEHAFSSVQYIMTSVPFGWLVRSIHSWGANLMVFFAFLHLATVFFAKAYRPPRELTWMSGVLLLFLALGFGFSGYLLPWNELSFFATRVGTEMAGTIPAIGDGVMAFLRGGERVGDATLSRFYGWHVGVLPALTTVLLIGHVLLVQKEGMSVPPALDRADRSPRSMPFVPHFLLRELFAWVFALGVLAALAALFPWELGEPADPFAAAPAGIEPEWYFMFLFQTLKVFPGGTILGMPAEAIPILLSGVAAVVLLLVPFLDRGIVRRGKSPLFTAAGLVVVVYIVVMTCWGYGSWVPAGIAAASVAVLALLSLVFRHPRWAS